jgi:hypothetical protein
MDSSVSGLGRLADDPPVLLRVPASDAGQARVVTAWVSLVRGTVPVCLPVESSALPGRRPPMPPSPA